MSLPVLRGSEVAQKVLELGRFLAEQLPESSTTTPVPTLRKGWKLGRCNWVVLALLILTLTVFAFLWAYQYMWKKTQDDRARQAGLRMKAEAFAQKIVRSFLPSIQVEKYRFRGLQRVASPMNIRFEDLGLELHNGTTVLQGVTGEFKAGRMAAIMGPSGAGKTTFMNTLCGKAGYGKMTGKVVINNHLIEDREGIMAFKPAMGFVPQDDVVHEALTVGEQIHFAAHLRGEPGTTRKRASRILEDVLQVMQIDHIRNSIVGGVAKRGISGGQRKRVNIGLELAANPTVLFLDEPTSGLDATSSLTIINSLKKLGELGMTSIMVIHQPRYSLFTLFDDVLLLGKGGRTVYMGPSQAAKDYFERLGFVMPPNENPADWLMDLIAGEVPNPRIPNFEPAMLFDLWERNKHTVAASYPDRVWTPADDRAALAAILDDEWRKIDQDKSGSMEQDELKQLIINCTGVEPEDEVVEELFERIGSAHQDHVTKKEFLNFLLSLQQLAIQETVSEDDDEDDDEELVEESNTLALGESENIRKLVKTGHGHGHQRVNRSFFWQFLVLVHRQLVNWWRDNSQRMAFLGVVTFAAVILAVMDKFICHEPDWSPAAYLNLHTCLALLNSVYSLQLFGADKVVFWRESASGVHVFAFYLARVLVNAFDLCLQGYVFASVYFLIVQPELSFLYYYPPFVLVSFASAGVGYFISSILPAQHGPFVAALTAFVSCGLMGHPDRILSLEKAGLQIAMDTSSITRWSVAMTFMKIIETTNASESVNATGGMRENAMLQMFQQAYYPPPTGAASYLEDPIGYWGTSTLALLVMGGVLHIGALAGLKLMYRDKQI